jgi:hypothetical protein
MESMRRAQQRAEAEVNKQLDEIKDTWNSRWQTNNKTIGDLRDNVAWTWIEWI